MDGYIKITNRGAGDRLGAQLTHYICQIIYAHFNNYYIEYNEERYPNSIFTIALKKFVDNYNKSKIKGKLVEFVFTDDWCKLNSFVVLYIKMDLISYFKKNLFEIINYLNELATIQKYISPFDINNTIVVHLRLDDVDFTNRIDYNGQISFDYIKNKMNEENLNYNDEVDYYRSQNITSNFNLYNCQAPLSDYKIENIIQELKKKYENYKIIIVTSPYGNVTLPYDIIRSEDPSVDLFYLTRAKIVILSRSTFALSSLYLTNAEEIYLPKWGYLSSLGLESKYSNTSFNYFN
jgi:hypothetical protein